MLPLVEFPQIVQHYTPWFEAVFSAEALVQFQRYLSGPIISENKTVEGINRLFVIESRNQSSLNRLLTASPFSEAVLNQQRLALLNSLEGTRVKPKGVLSVDDTLLTHYGEHFDEIAFLYDPSTTDTPGRTTWSTCTTAMTKRTTRSISSCGNRGTWTRSSRACRPQASA